MAARHMEDLVEYGKTVAGGGGGSAQPGGEAQVRLSLLLSLSAARLVHVCVRAGSERCERM
eukprot:442566-Rhodomonas_salina.5